MCKANRTAAILILRLGVLLVTGLIVAGEFSIRPENNTQQYITLSLTAAISLALIYSLPNVIGRYTYEQLDGQDSLSSDEESSVLTAAVSHT